MSNVRASIVAELVAHPELDALAQYVGRGARAAAEARRHGFPSQATRDLLPPESPMIAPERATTRYGNPLDLVQNGVHGVEQKLLIGALIAFDAKKELPSSPDAELELATRFVWLAAHSDANPLPVCDDVLGDRAAPLWHAVARLAEQPSSGGAEFGAAEALVAAAALAASSSEIARTAAEALRGKIEEPLLQSVLGASVAGKTSGGLRGELAPPPRGPFLTAVLAVTLVLLVAHVVRLVGRFAFAYRRPASLRLSERGLELEHRTELLGRVLRDRSTLIPLSNLARVTREVRYARVGMYAGLVALVIGSYFGMGLLVDGVRVPGGSGPLLVLGLLCIALGLAIDFVLSTLTDSVRGRCRIVVVPRKGRAVCIAALDPERADALLSALAEHARG